MHYQDLEFQRVSELFGGWASKHPRPLRVLDYGCGRGKYLRRLREIGCDVVGADVNERYLEEGEAAGFRVYDALKFDFAHLRFDIIFLSHLVEHLGPDDLVILIPRLCELLEPGGRLVLSTPVLGERFYHDFSHVRPYYPQSIRHAFGQQVSPLSYAPTQLIELTDIHFFRDPYRTRTWRSFYVGPAWLRNLVNLLNAGFDLMWKITGGRFGVLASWLGVYEKTPRQ